MTGVDELETRVTGLFAEQASTLDVGPREWDEGDLAMPTSLTEVLGRRRGRHVVAAVVAVAAVTALAVGVGNLRSGDDQSGQIRVRPAAPGAGAITWETKQVSLRARDFSIVADGKTYTAAAADVDVHSDPGDPTYQTLELTWQEQGTEMRWFIYFKSDGTDWWSDEMRTYDSHGEWIGYTGDFFRTKLGTAWTGDLDLSATERGIAGALHVHGVRLEAFKRPAVCATPGTGIVVESPYDPIDFTGNSVVRILDRSTCTPVSNPSAYRVEWAADDPSIATFLSVTACPPEITDKCANGSYVAVQT
jgi:hypothetical protein